MVTINKQIIEKIFDDKSFINEAYELLNLLIDLELEKEDDEIDFDFIDECGRAAVEINSSDEISKEKIISLISSKQFDSHIFNSTRRNLSSGAKLLLIAAVILASTISVSAAVSNITKSSVADSITSSVAENHSEKAESSAPRTKARAKKKNTKRALTDDSEFVCKSEIPYSESQQILVDCTNTLVNGSALDYSKQGDPYFEMLTEMPQKSANCDFDEEEYKSKNCRNTNDCKGAEMHEYGEWTVTVQPSCTELGLQERLCIKCKNRQECPVKATDKHDFKESVISTPRYFRDAPSEDGRVEYKCSTCGASYEMAVPFPKYVVLDANTFEFDNEQHEPEIIAVLDRNMMEISPLYYSVEYDFEYEINSFVIDFSSAYYDYESQLFARFQVIPPRTQLSGIASRKGALIPFWEKGELISDENCTGYEVQYSTSQDFADAQTVSLYGIDEHKMRIEELESGKTYYVRMRTVNENSPMHNSSYSYWSDVRKVTVK